MPARLRAAGALLGVLSTSLLGGCALLFDYGNYEESKPGTGGTGGQGAGGTFATGGTGGQGAGGQGAGGQGAGGQGAGGGGTGGCGAGGADSGLGPVKWLTTFSSKGGPSGDSAQYLAVGPAGAVYFTAQFEGEVTIGPDTLTPDQQYAVVLAKLDALGEPEWGKKIGERTPIGDKGVTYVANVAVGPDGKPVVGGAADGLVDIGTGLVPSNGYPDVFMDKLDSTGNLQWGHLYGETNSQIGVGVAVGSDNSVVTSGMFNYALGLYDPCPTLGTPTSSLNVFVAKHAPNGDCLWGKHFGGVSASLGREIALESNNKIALVGQFQGTIAFDSVAEMTSGNGGMDLDSFLVLLDWATGTAEAAWQHASTLNAGIFVSTDSGGLLFWGGNVANGSPEGWSMWVSQLGAWNLDVQSTKSIRLDAIDIDGLGHLLLTGIVAGNATVGGVTIIGDDAGDAFILSLNAANGDPIALTMIGGEGQQYPTSVRHDPTGGVVVLGQFGPSITAGCETRQAEGGSDVFVVKLGP